MTTTLDRQWVANHLALLQHAPGRKVREVIGVLLADTVAIASHARLGQVGGTRVDRAMVSPQADGCAVWGADFRVGPADAAFLNGCAAEALDFQEVLINPRNNGHAAVVIVPALLALAEQRGISGERLLRALWVAFAANIRLAEALGRGHRAGKAGFRTTSVVAPVAAALGVAALVSDDVELALNTVAICASSLSAGLLSSLSPQVGSYSLDKDFAVGFAARHPVQALQLAQAGADGPRQPLTGEHGWLASFGLGTEQPQRLLGNPLEADLGSYEIKPYPACFGCQSAITAALRLVERVPLERIDSVRIEVNQGSASSLSTRSITNSLAARFSLPYAVSSAMVRHRSGLGDFEGPALADPAVQEFMRRVDLRASVELTAKQQATGGFPAIVRVFSDGTEIDVQMCEGPQDGLDAAARQALFSAKVGALCSAPMAERLLALAREPERVAALLFQSP
ncbi:MAG TPA: MmgE/PrpD family protein [Roseateles sp.]|uniref:MmgE/PrpD family protein n=1 Tax=Roseateles sp. TaxID=1971397 RepID=UPI002ED90CB6